MQSLTFLGQFLPAIPAIVLAVLGLIGRDGVVRRVASSSGSASARVVFAIGLQLGARVFEARGPELLASAVRM